MLLTSNLLVRDKWIMMAKRYDKMSRIWSKATRFIDQNTFKKKYRKKKF